MTINDRPEFTSAEWMSILKTIQNTKSIRELADIATNEIGYSVTMGQSFPPLGSNEKPSWGRYFHYNVPEVILNYIKENYSKNLDPVGEYVLDLGQSVWLSDLREHPIFVETGYNKNIQTFLNIVGDVICVPSFTQTHGGYGIAGFGRPKDSFGEQFIWQVQIICQATHLRYVTFRKLFKEKVDLTNREMDVMELVATGKSNADIALMLDISAHTVNGYVRRLYLKLGVSDRVTATLRAVSLNLIG